MFGLGDGWAVPALRAHPTCADVKTYAAWVEQRAHLRAARERRKAAGSPIGRAHNGSSILSRVVLWATRDLLYRLD